jgi:hypothetical protein
MEKTSSNPVGLIIFGVIITALILGFAFNANSDKSVVVESSSTTTEVVNNHKRVAQNSAAAESEAASVSITIPSDYVIPTSLEIPKMGKFEIISQGVSDLSPIIDYVEQGITNEPFWSVSLPESIRQATCNFTTGGYVLIDVLMSGSRPNFIKDMRRTNPGVFSSEAIVIKAICYGCLPIRINKGMSMTDAIIEIKKFIP